MNNYYKLLTESFQDEVDVFSEGFLSNIKASKEKYDKIREDNPELLKHNFGKSRLVDKRYNKLETKRKEENERKRKQEEEERLKKLKKQEAEKISSQKSFTNDEFAKKHKNRVEANRAKHDEKEKKEITIYNKLEETLNKLKNLYKKYFNYNSSIRNNASNIPRTEDMKITEDQMFDPEDGYEDHRNDLAEALAQIVSECIAGVKDTIEKVLEHKKDIFYQFGDDRYDKSDLNKLIEYSNESIKLVNILVSNSSSVEKFAAFVITPQARKLYNDSNSLESKISSLEQKLDKIS